MKLNDERFPTDAAKALIAILQDKDHPLTNKNGMVTITLQDATILTRLNQVLKFCPGRDVNNFLTQSLHEQLILATGAHPNNLVGMKAYTEDTKKSDPAITISAAIPQEPANWARSGNYNLNHPPKKVVENLIFMTAGQLKQKFISQKFPPPIRGKVNVSIDTDRILGVYLSDTEKRDHFLESVRNSLAEMIGTYWGSQPKGDHLDIAIVRKEPDEWTITASVYQDFVAPIPGLTPKPAHR